MTIQECAKILLGYFPFEERAIPEDVVYPGRHSSVQAAMNAALQELYSKESPWVREDKIGEIVRPPASVTIAVTQYSKDATITGWESWMAGCTIVIDGHDVDNEIRGNAASTKLKIPFGGASGTKSATVYHDCITLDATVVLVVPPVRWNGSPLPSLMSGGSISNPIHLQDYGMHRNPQALTNVDPRRAGDLAGRIYGVSVENHSVTGIGAPINRLRLSGSASEQGTITSKAKLRPPDIDDITSNNEPPVPHGYAESVFLPVAAQKLTGSPFFRDQSGKDEIANAYKEAKTILASISTGLPRRFRFQA